MKARSELMGDHERGAEMTTPRLIVVGPLRPLIFFNSISVISINRKFMFVNINL